MKTVFSLRRNRAALRRLVRRLRHGRDGAAAIEFAFIALPMVAIYFGAAQVAWGVIVDRKVVQLTRTLADLTSQAGSIPDTELNNIFAASQSVMAPYTNVAPAMSITSIVVDANRNIKVCWSEARNGGTVSEQYPNLPEQLRVANSSVIVATTSYTFTLDIRSPFDDMVNIPISNAPVYMRPRIGQVKAGIEQVARVITASNGTTTTKMCS